MVQGKYVGTVKTPFGMKSGSVSLRVNGENLSGTIEALGKVNTFTNGKVVGDKFTFTGTLQVMFSKIDYKADGVVEGNTLKAIVKTSNGNFEIVGKRV